MIEEKKHIGSIEYDPYSDSFVAKCACGFSGKPHRYRFKVSSELYKHFDKNKKQNLVDLFKRIK